MEYHIGIDSTDSAELGMCTTYLGAVLLERLERLPVELISFPELIRLNPNVPWKTRGNGAISISYTGGEGLEKDILSVSEQAVEDLAVKEDPQTDPGLILLKGPVDNEIRSFYQRALHEILDVEDAMVICGKRNAMVRTWKKGRGAIGALAAIGASLEEFTYEAILYRPGHVKDRERDVDRNSLVELSGKYPGTFFNVDTEGKIHCIPNSPCPVIMGIRGIDHDQARRMMLETAARGRERWVLWRTNQHTNAHMEVVDSLKDPVFYSSISTEVSVMSRPLYGDGGHLSFDIADKKGNSLTAWAYEPTKGFRKDLSGLAPGDRIRVFGSIRKETEDHDAGLNLERVDVLELAVVIEEFNPRCPDCGGPTESMGRDQGLRCRKCGNRNGIRKEKRKVQREIKKGTIEPPEDAWRHLYRPKDLKPASKKLEGPPYYGVF